MGVPDPTTDPQFYDGVPMRRLMAFIIDSAIVLTIWLVVLLMGVVVSVLTLGGAIPMVVLALLGIGVTYRWLFLTQRSATPGMMMVGIEVRAADGSRCDPVTAFLHSAIFVGSLWFLPLAIVGWLLMAVSPYGRALHDAVLGTVVINRPI